MVTSVLVFQAPRIIRETACLLRSFGTKIFPIRHRFELSTLSSMPSSNSMVKGSVGHCVTGSEKGCESPRLERWCCADEREREKKEEEGKGKEGKNLPGRPKFKKLENGRFKCVEIGHEVPSHARDSYAQSKRCWIGLIDAALAHNKPPLNTFHQRPSRPHKGLSSKRSIKEKEEAMTRNSGLICTLTGNIVNKSEEHINGKRFLNMLEGNEQKKKRMKADSDISRPTPSVQNDLDALASLKGEQVLIQF
ncbi:hypothetical protein HYC85_006048 [Camellia sinensis]|uniref:Uncharacterized protein n=1 Tax=Camellia sinensis TaxID=4442 RepID=A0A7J7I178_CAMSI|nr:hypothetical protein HYC85_006048 [Camellia sinensis]